MSRDQSRSTSNDKRNRSMLSTHHISCNQSHLIDFFNESKGNKSAVLAYAQIPYQKVTPRWNQSAATWRNTSHKYSFSKDSRFKDYKVQYSDIIQPQIQSTRTSKSCTFGKGRRKPISQVILRNARQKPAPDCYNFQIYDQSTRIHSKGKTFGLGWKTYQKSFIDYRKDVYVPFQTEQNPPAKYQTRQTPGKQQKKFQMYGRLKMYTQKMSQSKNWVPGPRYSIKDRHLYQEDGLHQRNFGFGQRIDLAMPANNYPSAKYIIPGFCDKFKNIKHKSQNVNPQDNHIQA